MRNKKRENNDYERLFLPCNTIHAYRGANIYGGEEKKKKKRHSFNALTKPVRWRDDRKVPE